MLSALVNTLTTPLSHFGYGLLHARAMRVRLSSGISATALAPLFTRYALHHIGERDDPLAYRAMRSLPAVSQLVLRHYLTPIIGLQGAMKRRPPMLRTEIEQNITVTNMLAVRTRFFDRVVERGAQNDTQLVILGAGFDSRGHRTRNRPVFEVDAPQTQASKRKLMADLGVDDAHIVYVPVDFTQTRWLDALVDAGFDRARPATVLWEGVSYYLPPDDVHATLDMMRTLAPTSTLSFDYFSQRFIAPPPGFLWFVNRVLRAGGEPLRFGIDDPQGDGAALGALLGEHGMTLSSHHAFGRPRGLVGAFGGLVEGAVNAD